MRSCPKCQQVKADSDFYQRSDRSGKAQSYCKDCNKENVLYRQRKFKKMCAEYKGSKCCICGYDKCIGALEFHHLDPSKKDFTIAKQRRTSEERFDLVKIELDKCILVCSNCHCEIHAGLVHPLGIEPRYPL